MSFKKGDVVFVCAKDLEEEHVPLSEGPFFVLRSRTTIGRVRCWIMQNMYIIPQRMLKHPTELIKALV
jgi:hypothetical protein